MQKRVQRIHREIMIMNRDLSKTVRFKIYVHDSILFLYISNNVGKVKSMCKVSETDIVYNSIKHLGILLRISMRKIKHYQRY